MRTVNTFYVYVATMNDGSEVIMMVNNTKGEQVPMIYSSQEQAETPEICDFINLIAENNKMFIDLREYVMVRSLSEYYPTNKLM